MVVLWWKSLYFVLLLATNTQNRANRVIAELFNRCSPHQGSEMPISNRLPCLQPLNEEAEYSSCRMLMRLMQQQPRFPRLELTFHNIVYWINGEDLIAIPAVSACWPTFILLFLTFRKKNAFYVTLTVDTFIGKGSSCV